MPSRRATTRLVAPVSPSVSGVAVLAPRLLVEGVEYRAQLLDMSAVPVSPIAVTVAALAAERDAVLDATDIILHGYPSADRTDGDESHSTVPPTITLISSRSTRLCCAPILSKRWDRSLASIIPAARSLDLSVDRRPAGMVLISRAAPLLARPTNPARIPASPPGRRYQIIPRARRSAIASGRWPSSVRMASVCWPSSGVGPSASGCGLSLRLIGWPTTRMSPSAG